MLIGTLTPAWLRTTYLLGVDLGSAWAGANGDAAMTTLLQLWTETAQGKLGIQFARQRVLTYPDPAKVLGVDYEIQGEPLTWFPLPPYQAHFLIPLPFAHVQSIERVRLFFGKPGVDPRGEARYQVPPEWIVFTQKEGVLKILPTIGMPVLPPMSAAGYDMAYVLGRQRYDLPGVWAVDYTIGYGQIPLDVAQWIGMQSAIQVLGLAGMGLDISHGLGSESLSMDGITESISYGQGTHGPYSGLIETYKTALECLDPYQLRVRYKGIKIAVF